jgi:hypothetical protein
MLLTYLLTLLHYGFHEITLLFCSLLLWFITFLVCRNSDKLSSHAPTLGSWVRVPLEAWISVSVYSVLVLSHVCTEAVRRADTSPKKSYGQCVEIRKWQRDQETTKGCRAIDQWMNINTGSVLKTEYIDTINMLLDIIYHPVFCIKQRFGDWILSVFRWHLLSWA